MKRVLAYIICFVCFPLLSVADEGMWEPSNIPDSIYKQMQIEGFKLLKKDIYNSDSSSLTDVVPRFGKSCSSGIISSDGLLITNYHCARYFIRTHSTVTDNLIDNGFCANNLSEELTNNNLTAEFIKNIIDVTKDVLQGTTESSTIDERDSIISKNINQIKKRFTDSLHLKTNIQPFFFGTNYVLYLTEEFKDIRLVYCPPMNIANFGGDKDDWTWPRHAADFAIFRIYSNLSNKPSEISKSNVPYKPSRFLKISTAEVKENDFVMVMGYPGSTEEYLPTSALKTYRDSIIPIRLFARKKHLEIMKQYMDSSKYTHLNYFSKYASSSNNYLKWLSDRKQLSISNKIMVKNNAIIDTSLERKLIKAYSAFNSSQKITAYYFEGLLSMDIIRFANNIKQVIDNKNTISENTILRIVRAFHKAYTPQIDRDFYLHLINDVNSIPKQYDLLAVMNQKTGAKLSQYEKIKLKLYLNSILLDTSKFISLVKKHPNTWINIIKQDYLYTLSEKVYEQYRKADNESQKQKEIIDSLQRISISQLRSKKKILYSDANSTLRFSFGKIKKYESNDAILMDYKTTMAGIKEKYDTSDSNYVISQTFLPFISPSITTCIVSSCHTTGGNSGSPVLTKNGTMIGLNFDRNIEGTVNDYIYQGQVGRNIWVTSEYILYLLQRYSKADHILHSLITTNQ